MFSLSCRGPSLSQIATLSTPSDRDRDSNVACFKTSCRKVGFALGSALHRSEKASAFIVSAAIRAALAGSFSNEGEKNREQETNRERERNKKNN